MLFPGSFDHGFPLSTIVTWSQARRIIATTPTRNFVKWLQLVLLNRMAVSRVGMRGYQCVVRGIRLLAIVKEPPPFARRYVRPENNAVPDSELCRERRAKWGDTSLIFDVDRKKLPITLSILIQFIHKRVSLPPLCRRHMRKPSEGGFVNGEGERKGSVRFALAARRDGELSSALPSSVAASMGENAQ